jgi:hypothetical protein
MTIDLSMRSSEQNWVSFVAANKVKSRSNFSSAVNDDTRLLFQTWKPLVFHLNKIVLLYVCVCACVCVLADTQNLTPDGLLNLTGSGNECTVGIPDRAVNVPLTLSIEACFLICSVPPVTLKLFFVFFVYPFFLSSLFPSVFSFQQSTSFRAVTVLVLLIPRRQRPLKLSYFHSYEVHTEIQGNHKIITDTCNWT